MNSSLVICNAELKERIDQLTLYQSLADLFQYLINLLSLSSYSVTILGVSANGVSECLANTVSKIWTDDNAKLFQEVEKIVNEFSSSTSVQIGQTTSNEDHLVRRWKFIVHLFRHFLRYDSSPHDEVHATDNDLILFLINLQTIKHERNYLSHILPPWKNIHLSIPQIARSLTRIRMSIDTINQAHDIYAYKPMVIKIFTIINGIFTELKNAVIKFSLMVI